MPTTDHPAYQSPVPASASPSTTQVLRRFRVVFNAVRSHFQQIETQAGLGGAQVWALSLVRDHPAIGIGDLARFMDIRPSTASNLIKTLQRRELISMTKAPQDRRNVHLNIAPAGLQVLQKVAGPFQGVLPQALSKLPAETLQRMDQDLGALIQFLTIDDPAGKTPMTEN